MQAYLTSLAEPFLSDTLKRCVTVGAAWGVGLLPVLARGQGGGGGPGGGGVFFPGEHRPNLNQKFLGIDATYHTAAALSIFISSMVSHPTPRRSLSLTPLLVAGCRTCMLH